METSSQDAEGAIPQDAIIHEIPETIVVDHSDDLLSAQPAQVQTEIEPVLAVLPQHETPAVQDAEFINDIMPVEVAQPDSDGVVLLSHPIRVPADVVEAPTLHVATAATPPPALRQMGAEPDIEFITDAVHTMAREAVKAQDPAKPEDLPHWLMRGPY